MSEENYHELDLEETQANIALDSYTSSVASSLAEEYTSYASSAEAMLGSYYSEADLSESDGGNSSESEMSEKSSSHGGGVGGFYTGVLTEQMEKEIDYLPIRDWQGELQALLALADSHDKFRALARLGLDFQHAASLYARVIVSECKLPENQKTIHTADVGGVAGGFKVICQGILFKVAVDKHGMYGSDANAAKAAGHEFKSSTAFFGLQIPDVQLPLMAIIDYRGFRVTAMSLLPISGQDTLVYGSADGGKTVMASDPAFNALMERAGKLLNLKPHLCGRYNPQALYTSVDVEGHVTLKFKTKAKTKEDQGLSPAPTIDPAKSTQPALEKMSNDRTEPKVPFKRSYVMLDLARLFPPQMPLHPPEKGSKHRSYLYELLRPEYVKTNPVPLSSDAFSPFNNTDPHAKENNDEVAAACQRLVTVRIPQFAAFMEKSTASQLNSVQHLTCDKLVSQLHRHGINIRFLGMTRRCFQHPTLRRIALTEMVARVIKDQINEILRNTTEKVQLPVEEPYREAVTDFLNQLFANAHNSETFWLKTIQPAVLTKFSLKKLDLASKDTPIIAVESPAETEKTGTSRPLRTSATKRTLTIQPNDEPNLRDYVNVLEVWERVSVLTGVVLRRDALRVMSSGLGISSTDIKALTSRIRITDAVNSALAISVAMDAKMKRGTEAFRLYLRANQLFSDCLQVSASNPTTYYHWGIMLHEMSQHSYFRNKQNSLRLLKLGALPKLAQAVHLNSSFLEAHAELAWTLLDFLLHPTRFEAVNSSTSNRVALKDTTAILERAGHHLSISLRANDQDRPHHSHHHHTNPSSNSSKSTPNVISSLTASSDSEATLEKKKKKKSSTAPKTGKSGSIQKDEAAADPLLNASTDLETTPGMQELLRAFETRITQTTNSLFCALLYALENCAPLQPFLISRGTDLTDLDLNDASFLPKRGFILIAQKCPNLVSLRLRNAVFLDAATAGEMFRNSEEEYVLPVAGAGPPSPTPHREATSSTTAGSSGGAATASSSTHQPAPMLGTLAHASSSPAGSGSGIAIAHGSSSGSSSPSLSALSLSKIKAKFGATPPMLTSTPPPVTCFMTTLKHLKKLKFSCCDHLTDIEHFEAIFWPALESLQFDKAGLSDGFFSTRLDPRMLPALTHINMSGTSVTDASLTKISQHFGKQLSSLELKVCLNLQYASCFCLMVQNPSLLGLKSLTELNLSGCRGFAGSAFAQFAKALPLANGASSSRWHSHRPHLSSLLGSNRHASSPSNGGLGSSSGQVPGSPLSVTPPSLTVLNLDGCSMVTEDSWNLLPKKLPYLKSISMEKSQASGTTLQLLGSHCPRLEYLHAPACKGLDPVSLLKVLQGCPNLTYLDASFWMWNKTDLEPKLNKTWTASALPPKLELRQLFVCAWNVDTTMLQLLYMRCPNLTNTDISGCPAGPELIAQTLTTHCKQLDKLVASGFSVTDEAVEALTNECKGLRTLSITKAHDITDLSLQSLCRSTMLTRLNCSHSPFITNEGIQMLVTAVPTLTRLGLKGSKLITAEFIFEKLRHSCAELNVELDSGKSIPWQFPLT